MPIKIGDKILRNTGWNLAARLAHLPVSIIIVPFIISRVGAEWYGIWITLFALIDYISFLDLGMGAATIKYVAEYNAAGDRLGIGDIVISTCLFNLTFIPPLALCYLFSEAILDFFTIPLRDLADARFLFGWILLTFAVTQFASVFRNVLIGLQRMHITNLCDLGHLLAYAVSALIVLGCGGGLTRLIVVLFGLRCLSSTACVLCLLQALPELRRRPGRLDRGLLRKFFSYGLKLQAASLVGLFNFQFDKLLIGHLLRIEFVAFYDIGAKLASLTRVIPSSVMGPVVPAAAELQTRGDTARPREMCLRGTRYLALTAAPLSGLLVSAAAPILSLWLGTHATPSAVLALQLLAIGYFFNIVTGVVSSLGRGMGVLRYEVQASVVIITLNLGLSVTLTLHMGFAGALIGTCLAMTIGNLFYLVSFCRYMRIPAFALLRQVLLKPVATAVMAGGALAFVHLITAGLLPFESMSRTCLAVYVCVAVVVYLSVYFVFLLLLRCLDRSDVELVSRLWAAVRMA